MPRSERALWGSRIDPVSGYASVYFASLLCLVMPLHSQTGASDLEQVFPIICWGNFNLSLGFVGAGWL